MKSKIFVKITFGKNVDFTKFLSAKVSEIQQCWLPRIFFRPFLGVEVQNFKQPTISERKFLTQNIR